MSKNKPYNRFWPQLLYFFPLQLLFVHLKKNQQLIFFWIFFFLALFQKIGNTYGLPLLFLEPEYLGKLNFWSYYIVGFAFGGFVMSFNISSYIMNGFRFPFLATLSKPFYKYCLNNSFLPFLFLISYGYCTYGFLNQNEELSQGEILWLLTGFYLGYFLFTGFSMIYFMATNKDFEKLFGKDLAKVVSSDTGGDEPARLLLHKKESSWYNRQSREKTWRVNTYLGGRFQFRATRPVKHYDFEMLSKVFRQNHVNASFFELLVILSILTLGFFRDFEWFIIPAGATIILLITLVLMATSAIRSWLRGWTWLVIFGLLVCLNAWSKYDTFYFENKAYGLDYSQKVPFSNESIQYGETEINRDKALAIQRLSNRLKPMDGKKPKAVFVATSGGGSRAMFWSFLALQHLNQASQGKLYENCVLSTGSSGGMIGSAYFRELVLQDLKNQGNRQFSIAAQEAMSKDLLNPVFFTMAVNDMLIKTQRFKYKGKWYWKDRAYAFEEELNKITGNLLDKNLGEYTDAVQAGDIPQMIFSPSIINEGRRLLISSAGLAFLEQRSGDDKHVMDVDYLHLLQDNQALNTRFTSVLRINATFPYLMPNVSLPTDPGIEVFDSGLRDNYGIQTTCNYILSVKEWLEQNTSGLIVLQIRDGIKNKRIDQGKTKRSLAAELLSPLGSLYGNLFQVQDFQNDQYLASLKALYNGPIEVLDYQLNTGPQNAISLSWHLTHTDKSKIRESIVLPENREVEKKLKQIFNE